MLAELNGEDDNDDVVVISTTRTTIERTREKMILTINGNLLTPTR